MVKSVDLPLRVYEDLMKVTQEFSLMAKKPVSVQMTVDLLIEIYRAHLNNPCALDQFSVRMRTSDLMSPEEFMNYWDEPHASTNVKLKPKRKSSPKTKKA